MRLLWILCFVLSGKAMNILEAMRSVYVVWSICVLIFMTILEGKYESWHLQTIGFCLWLGVYINV